MKIEKGYKIAFNNMELNLLNQINEGLEANDMRISLYKLYHHFLKATELGVNEYTVTFKLLHKRLTYAKLKDIKLTSLKERIYKLRDLGLLEINKIGNKNSYKLIARISNPTENPTENENITTVEITELDESCKFTKVNKDIINNIDIDSNSETSKNLNYEKYIEKAEKVTSFLEVLKLTRSLMKKMKVKSNNIQSKILGSLEKSWSNITKANLENYILKVIQQKRENYYKSYNKYIAPTQFARFTHFNNYNQRSYTKEQLEAAL